MIPIIEPLNPQYFAFDGDASLPALLETVYKQNYPDKSCPVAVDDLRPGYSFLLLSGGTLRVQTKSSGNLDVASSKTAHCPYG